MNGSSGKHKFVASYRIGDFPNAGLKRLPWTVAPCDGVLINAYDFLKNHRTRKASKKLLESDPALESLAIRGDVILDSGAYYFVRSNDTNIDPAEIVNLAVKLRVPYVVTLDHPFPPGVSMREIHARIRTTARNTETMERSLKESCEAGGPCLIPALHGHDEATLIRSHKSQKKFWSDQTTTVGLGSLALLAQTGAIRQAARSILLARDILEGKHMHVFSVGSPLLMHFAFACGADSVDSQSWMMSAAFKQAQLPGMAQIRLSYQERDKDKLRYETRRAAFETQLLKLHKEECLMVKDWVTGTPIDLRDSKDAAAYTDTLEDSNGVNRIHNRACHNLAMATFESRRASAAAAQGKLVAFISLRHQSGPYRLAIAEILEAAEKAGRFRERPSTAHGPIETTRSGEL
jgi:hypothetical protein